MRPARPFWAALCLRLGVLSLGMLAAPAQGQAPTIANQTSQNTRPQNLPLPDWLSAEQNVFLPVPAGERRQRVRLHLHLGTLPAPVNQQPLRAAVLLNGRRAATVTLSPGTLRPGTLRPDQPDLSVPLPDLEPGINTVRLQTLGDVPAGICASVGQALPLQEASLEFQTRFTADPPLADLPDGLFLTGRHELVVGTFDVDEWTDDTLNAALGLAQLLSGPRPVLWQSQSSSAGNSPTDSLSSESLPSDFRVTLRRDPALSSPARLELHWGNLVVRYRQPQDLAQVVNTLASAGVRQHLAGSRADLGTPALGTLTLLPRPELRPPRTLGDLGVGQYRVQGGAVVTQALPIAPLWEAKGPPSGLIHYRLPLPRTNQEQVTLRVGGRRSDISPDGAQTVDGQEVQARFEGAQAGPGEALSFELQARGLARCDSALEVLPDTQLNLHLRARSGLAGLPHLLARDPSVLLPADAQAIAVALNLAGSLRAWGLGDVLPWQAHLIDPQRDVTQDDKATLELRVAGDSRNPPPARLSMTQPLLLKPQVSLSFAPGEQATSLGRYWSRVPAQLGSQPGDYLRDVLIGPGGRVLAADASRTAAPSPLRRHALWFSLLALPLLALWSWQREHRRLL